MIDIEAIARETLAALDERRQIVSWTTRFPAFDLDDAYRVARTIKEMRSARGERPVGRKIGFTNRTIWAEYGVYAPIWGYMYDTTVHDLADIKAAFSIDHLREPRIEPEIVFGLSAAPRPGLGAAELLGCIAWVAHSFEIVQSLFADWKFAAADTVAAFGLHGALLIGPRHPVAGGDWGRSLASFAIALKRDGAVEDRGNAANVLDGPLSAIGHLVDLLAHDEVNLPLAAGEIITTGTLTRALPVRRGETWSTSLTGVALEPIALRFG
jgi:2-oxo-3-hexenedioate decarboxylase